VVWRVSRASLRDPPLDEHRQAYRGQQEYPLQQSRDRRPRVLDEEDERDVDQSKTHAEQREPALTKHPRRHGHGEPGQHERCEHEQGRPAVHESPKGDVRLEGRLAVGESRVAGHASQPGNCRRHGGDCDLYGGDPPDPDRQPAPQADGGGGESDGQGEEPGHHDLAVRVVDRREHAHRVADAVV
jgi:hypothetical protein